MLIACESPKRPETEPWLHVVVRHWWNDDPVFVQVGGVFFVDEVPPGLASRIHPLQ